MRWIKTDKRCDVCERISRLEMKKTPIDRRFETRSINGKRRSERQRNRLARIRDEFAIKKSLISQLLHAIETAVEALNSDYSDFHQFSKRKIKY